MMANVKNRRRYDATGRRDQARRSRELVLDVAERQFLEFGYAATTVATVAREAGVSVETVYKAFGSKSGLVRAIYERALTGRAQVPAYERSDAMRERETDPRAIMRNWGALTAEVASVVTPIRLLIRAAAEVDPDVAGVLARSEDERMARMAHHARFLADRGYLRDDVSLSRATDVLWLCSSVELHELLVLRRGWSAAEFAAFVADLMIKELLPEGG